MMVTRNNAARSASQKQSPAPQPVNPAKHEPEANAAKGNRNGAAKSSDNNDTETGEDTAKVSASILHPGKGARKSIFARLDEEQRKIAADKINAFGAISQQLAEASDLFNEGAGKAKEAMEVANKASVGLYQARASGMVTIEEINAKLRDIFGAKLKADGTPGKTPDGKGEDIRKRVVRAYQAKACLNGDADEAGAFFDGLDGESYAEGERTGHYTLQDVVDGLDNGTESIWAAYEKFAAIKRNMSDRVDMAYDLKKIAKLSASLTEDVAKSARIFNANLGLMKAYGELLKSINLIGEAVAELPEDESETEDEHEDA